MKSNINAVDDIISIDENKY